MSPSARSTLQPATLLRSHRLLVALLALGLAGCQSMGESVQNGAGHDTDLAVGLQQEPRWLGRTSELSELSEPTATHTDIWERMREGFALQDSIGINPRIEQQRLWFASNPSFIQKCSERSGPYIHYIVERLEERNMPMELALLPMIESAYNPLAYSRSHAVGLWQFIPSTGRYFNLRQTSWYDGRRDITASTQAAMDYLSRLHKMFNGDWLLALAAYNAGEGTVSRAMERNQKLGLPTDYWNLPLPKETQDYVPKLLALSQMVLAPDAYGVNLTPVANEPYFESVVIGQRMDLSRVAALADLDEDELFLLNPAFKQGITLDGPQHLLVPTDKAELLAANLLLMKPEEQVDWQEYRVRAGDSLHTIANRHHLTVNTLKDINRLSSHNLSIGQVLNIPAQPGLKPSEPLFQTAAAQPTVRTYKVKQGDTLWQVAKQHGLKVSDLQRWNKLSNKRLKVGQSLLLQGGSAPSVVASAGQPEREHEREAVTYYRVQKGDSLYLIAKRLNIEMAHLQLWNPRSGRDLKPGQTLTLRLPR